MAVTPRRVVLTGATGLIGSHVTARLLDDPAWQVRVVGRRAPAGLNAAGTEWVEADLAEPESLRGVCRGADALLHLASVISPDQDACTAVNVRGTARLMEEATRSGVTRVTHLSTAAVYGHGPHRGPAVDEVEPAPVSVTSATRLAGERPALSAGAVVLRPGLVLGAGDRWVVPALAELRRRVSARWASGAALLSVVGVADLARLIVATLSSSGVVGPSVHHASHPRPVRLNRLLGALEEHAGLPPVPDRDWPWAECVAALATSGSWVSTRQFALLAQDNWFDSARVWRLAGVDCDPDPLADVATWGRWYRQHLGAGTSGTTTAHDFAPQTSATGPSPCRSARRARPARACTRS